MLFIDFVGERPLLAVKNGSRITMRRGKGRDETALLLSVIKKIKSDIYGVAAVAGPGRFSAVRGAVMAANMLSWLLGVKARGLIKTESDSTNDLILRSEAALRRERGRRALEPFYGALPNITKSAAASRVKES